MNQGLLLRHVAVGYRNRKVLADLNVPCIPSGSVVAILGPNAVGKSTLLKAVAGIRPASGEILLDGADLARMSLPERVRRVGYLPQALPQTSSLIAYETVLSACRAVRPDLPIRQIEADIDRTFDALNLRELAMRRLSEMSGGQRQMVGLAQVLVRKPRLLLLDEPTSALDLHWQLNVLDVVRSFAERDGSICLMAMHDINLALRLCDRVVVLKDGRAIADGAPGEVMTNDVLRKAYSVEGRIERCSQGMPVVLIDRALERRSITL